jgi:hypothetical protein
MYGPAAAGGLGAGPGGAGSGVAGLFFRSERGAPWARSVPHGRSAIPDCGIPARLTYGVTFAPHYMRPSHFFSRPTITTAARFKVCG